MKLNMKFPANALELRLSATNQCLLGQILFKVADLVTQYIAALQSFATIH